MNAAILLAAVASTASPYPVEAMLSAFGDVCLAANSPRVYGSANADRWLKLALRNGWVELRRPPPPGKTSAGNSDARTYFWANALNYEVAASLGQGVTEDQVQASLLKKRVGGREVYLSIVGVDAGNPTLAECRLRDALGDGVYKLPITQAAVEAWLGKPVKKARGWYKATEYYWLEGKYRSAVRLHFGFEGKPLGRYGAKYDPYAQYGMTLVRSELDEIIVT